MNYTPGKKFIKNAQKLTANQKSTLKKKLELWELDPTNTTLHDHGLTGNYTGYRSLNIGGDLRLVYRQISQNQVLLYDISTHSQLYK